MQMKTNTRYLHTLHRDALLHALEWVRRRGGTCSARDLLSCGVCGVHTAGEAKAVLLAMAVEGFGSAAVEWAPHGERVVFRAFGQVQS